MLRAMAHDDWLTHLGQVPLFADCSRKQLQAVAAATTELDVPAGKVFVREGERGHEAFVIVEGTAVVSRKDQQIATLKAGDVVGELAPLTGGVRTATVVAESQMLVLVIGQREFGALLDEVPGLAVRVLHNLAARMVELDELAFK
jgi:CRP/FNR family cyclic AMP-dependent transcriptional regulator